MNTAWKWMHPIDGSDQWDGFNEPGIEHFAGSPIRHLAREINQNSLDARVRNPVRLDFKLVKVKRESIPDVDGLSSTIARCLETAKETGESAKAEAYFEQALEIISKPQVPVLQVTERNTSGMRGPASNGTPYYAFMKAKGQSRKEANTATGSFGIGKFAPYAVSKLRTVFVSTIYNDGESLVQLTQGKTVLMSHDDEDGQRHQGTGFWGLPVRCQPVQNSIDQLPEWVQHATKFPENELDTGTTLSILAFDERDSWQELLAASVIENFFGAIFAGELEVAINDKYYITKDSIGDLFTSQDIYDALEQTEAEIDQFKSCAQYLQTLQNDQIVIVEESEQPILGRCQLRIIVSEGLPKKVCVLRNGMFISDSLQLHGLKHFSDFKEFVAVVECKSAKGNELLRAMEPPRHDNFEPARLATKTQQRKGEKALRKLATWIREMLKRHAKDPVSDVTTLDELSEYFADEAETDSAKDGVECNPAGNIIVRAKPLRRSKTRQPRSDGDEDMGNNVNGDGGGGSDGAGGGDGVGGTGASQGGRGGGGADEQGKLVSLENVRTISSPDGKRQLSFSPTATGTVQLRLFVAGADQDYPLSIKSATSGTIVDGKIQLAVVADERTTLSIEAPDDSDAAITVIAHEV